MSYKTVEVELENGRVRPKGAESLPPRAQALLTILEPNGDGGAPSGSRGAAGLRMFLEAPDFPLTPEQFRASMAADAYDQ